ncbi:MAG: TetR/AcrR family transcriptional regulator [Galactobacter sp.]
MALTRAQVVGTATTILREYGLGDLTMRRLARELGVAPGGLYWHVADKQDLLVAVTQELLDAVDLSDAPSPPELGRRLATALLPVPDAADVLRVALTWRPRQVRVLAFLRERAARHGVPESELEGWARGALDLVLGAVADHQEAARAAVAPPSAPKGAAVSESEPRPVPPTLEATLARVHSALTRWSRG